MLAFTLLPLIGIGLLALALDDDFEEAAAASRSDASGTEEDDMLLGGGENDLLSGLGGDDELRGEGGDDRILAGDGSDLAIGGAGADALFGEDGDDTLWGIDGDDTLDGGPGDDILRGDAGEDLLLPGAGADAALGGAGDDEISGAFFSADDLPDLPDRLDGGEGEDRITGDDGDLVTGGGGADILRVLGIDQPDATPVTITDFDPEEDTLVLVDDAGNDVSFAPFGETPQEGEFDGLPFVEIRATPDEAGTEVIYDGSVIALLRDTPVSVLDGDSAWLVNRNALLLVQLSAAPGVAA